MVKLPVRGCNKLMNDGIVDDNVDLQYGVLLYQCEQVPLGLAYSLLDTGISECLTSNYEASRMCFN